MHVETGSMHACPAGRAHRTLPLWGYLMCTARPSFWFCAPIPARSASSALQSLNIPPKPGKEKGELWLSQLKYAILVAFTCFELDPGGHSP